MPSVAIPGIGSVLYYSLDGGVTYARVAQLQRAVPRGSRTQLVDRTNILTPDTFTRPQPVRVDCDEIDLAGVLIPQNATQDTLGTLQANLSIVNWQLILSDGVTTYTWLGAVSEFVPFEIVANKFIPFKAKIAVIGGITGPSSGSPPSGSTVTRYALTPSPNGLTTNFTTSPTVTVSANALVFRNGVKETASQYSISGTGITFTTAPATGDTIELYQ